MENFFEVAIGHGVQMQTFEVKDYAQPENGKCKFEVYLKGQLMLCIDPDEDSMKVCENPGGLQSDTIHQLVNQIEAYHL